MLQTLLGALSTGQAPEVMATTDTIPIITPRSLETTLPIPGTRQLSPASSSRSPGHPSYAGSGAGSHRTASDSEVSIPLSARIVAYGPSVLRQVSLILGSLAMCATYISAGLIMFSTLTM